MHSLFVSVRLASLLAALALCLLVAPAFAQNCGNGNGNGNGNGCKKDGDPSIILNDTPELSSVLLMGTGLSGIAAYAAARWRSRRRPSSTDTEDRYV